jgi:hypothetical protein
MQFPGCVMAAGMPSTGMLSDAAATSMSRKYRWRFSLMLTWKPVSSLVRRVSESSLTWNPELRQLSRVRCRRTMIAVYHCACSMWWRELQLHSHHI